MPDTVDNHGPAQDRDVFGTRADLPFAGLERATWVLRGQLRTIADLAATDQPNRVLDWDTLTVQGPTEHIDPDGRNWFTYTATVGTRPLRPLEPTGESGADQMGDGS